MTEPYTGVFWPIKEVDFCKNLFYALRGGVSLWPTAT